MEGNEPWNYHSKNIKSSALFSSWDGETSPEGKERNHAHQENSKSWSFIPLVLIVSELSLKLITASKELSNRRQIPHKNGSENMCRFSRYAHAR